MKAVIAVSFVLLMVSRHCKSTLEPMDNTGAAKNIAVPAYSETGANTFGAYIDQQPWTTFGQYKASLGYADNTLQKAILVNGGLTTLNLGTGLNVYQQGTEIRSESLGFIIVKKGSSFAGQYDVPGQGDQGYNTIFWSDYVNVKLNYYCSIKNPMKLTVKKDTVYNGKHIIAGTFQGYIYDSAAHDSIRISNGVFDVDLNSP